MLEPVRRPPLIRAGEVALRGLAAVGLTLPSLDPDVLEAAARKAGGLADLGPPDHRAGLEQVAAAAADPAAALSPFGRLALRKVVVRALVQRARWVNLRNTEPALLRTPLVPPLLVVGLPRSGTTYLHRLLAVCGDARALHGWEIREALPPPSGSDTRHADCVADLSMIRRIAPGLDAKHHLAADEPEECFPILNATLVSAAFWCMFPLFRYLDWYLAAEQSGPYQLWADVLRFLQAQTPEQRLTLKSPVHTAHLDAILAHVPEVMLVRTQRDPVAVVGSANSLFHTFHSVSADRVDPGVLGRRNLAMLVEVARRGQRSADRLGDRLLDVAYDDLCADPVGTVARVRRHFGLPFSDTDRSRVTQAVARRAQHRFGRHDYALAECGLTEAEVRAAFAADPPPIGAEANHGS